MSDRPRPGDGVAAVVAVAAAGVVFWATVWLDWAVPDAASARSRATWPLWTAGLGSWLAATLAVLVGQWGSRWIRRGFRVAALVTAVAAATAVATALTASPGATVAPGAPIGMAAALALVVGGIASTARRTVQGPVVSGHGDRGAGSGGAATPPRLPGLPPPPGAAGGSRPPVPWIGGTALTVGGALLAVGGLGAVALVIGIPIGVPALVLAAIDLPVGFGSIVWPSRRLTGWVAGLCTVWAAVAAAVFLAVRPVHPANRAWGLAVVVWLAAGAVQAGRSWCRGPGPSGGGPCRRRRRSGRAGADAAPPVPTPAGVVRPPALPGW